MTPENPSLQPPEDVPPVSAEELVEGEVRDEALADESQAPRRYPSTKGGMVYLLVLGIALVGLLMAWFGSWRVGVQVFAGSLAVAGVARLLLPIRDAGMLAVRNKYLDVFVFVAAAVGLVVLSITIPDRP